MKIISKPTPSVGDEFLFMSAGNQIGGMALLATLKSDPNRKAPFPSLKQAIAHISSIQRIWQRTVGSKPSLMPESSKKRKAMMTRDKVYYFYNHKTDEQTKPDITRIPSCAAPVKTRMAA